MQCIRSITAHLAGVLLATSLPVVSGVIDPADKYAWSEHSGWLNHRTTHAQAQVYPDHMEGFVWSESLGWIKLGSHSGGDAHTYLNTDSTNWGVNNDGGGHLSGYAWSENSGWINFNPTHSQVSISMASGVFSGYAWSESVGWIHFSGADYKTKVGDSDGDTLHDLADPDPNSIDADHDGLPDNLDAAPSSQAVNACSGSNATLSGTIASGTQVSCRAAVSITATAQVQTNALLGMIAPTIRLLNGFQAEPASFVRMLPESPVTARPISVGLQNADKPAEATTQTGLKPFRTVSEAMPSRPVRLRELPEVLQTMLGAAQADVADLTLDAGGRYLLFSTAAPLVSDDANDVRDVYLLDSRTAYVRLLSRSQSGVPGNAPSSYPSMDGLAEHIVFQSDATNLVDGDVNGVTDLFYYDHTTLSIERITSAAAASRHPALDAAGTQLYFDRTDEAGYSRIELLDMANLETGTLSLTPESMLHHPAISSDRRYLTFLATDLEAATPCRTVIQDRQSLELDYQDCPHRLLDAENRVHPHFSADAQSVLWTLDTGEVVETNNRLIQ